MLLIGYTGLCFAVALFSGKFIKFLVDISAGFSPPEPLGRSTFSTMFAVVSNQSGMHINKQRMLMLSFCHAALHFVCHTALLHHGDLHSGGKVQVQVAKIQPIC